MKCPVMVNEDIRCHDNQLTDTSDCLKEHCAWWLEDIEGCSVKAVAGALLSISGAAWIGRKVVYVCSRCHVLEELVDPQLGSKPFGWSHQERVDGTMSWLCPDCAGAHERGEI